MLRALILALMVAMTLLPAIAGSAAENDRKQAEFFENKIRPLLSKHCYECHSEQAGEQQGGLLLDRQTGWLEGGDRDRAVVPGEPEASLLIKAVRYQDEDLQMPPEYQLADSDVRLLEQWIRRGAPGPRADLGDTQFSRLGDQQYLFAEAKDHWAFQPVKATEPPEVDNPQWKQSAIDRFVFARLAGRNLEPSRGADPRTLIRRLSYDLTGLPPTPEEVEQFIAACEKQRPAAIREAVDRLIASPAFGEHIGRMWLDVARYADTDSFYRPDTRTPHYFPFAFTYRDYVVDAFNSDKPYDQFIREQLAADLMGFPEDSPEIAALGFLAVGPHASRNQQEALDDWIDVTSRGLMGMTAACARCHDHKFEPIPTADYYALRGVFASINRPHPLREDLLPALPGYQASEEDRADYEKKRAAIDKKIAEAGDKTKGGNNKAVAREIRETELAQLLLFHPGAPAHAMIVSDRGQPVTQPIYVRGDPGNRGDVVPRRFLSILDPEHTEFSPDNSGRLDLAERIVSPDNPLTARVFVNRVWGRLLGSHLVETPSDFGLQGARPTHPELLDWLADDFVSHGWSTKRLVRQIVLSRTYAQSGSYRDDASRIDSENRLLWRANRKHLSIEAIRDSLLSVAGRLDRTPRGHAEPLWGEGYTRRRAIYGYVNRFNLDPTLRVFDFPTPMQSQPARGESIVAPQALFTMNSPFVVDQAAAITELPRFTSCKTDEQRAEALFEIVFQRAAAPPEVSRVVKIVELQSRFFPEPAKKKSTFDSPWPLVAQALLMSNEFQYID
jgi:hypothetical protein